MRLKLLVVFLSLFAFTFSTVNATPTSSFFNTKSSYAKKNENLAKSFRQKICKYPCYRVNSGGVQFKTSDKN